MDISAGVTVGAVHVAVPVPFSAGGEMQARPLGEWFGPSRLAWSAEESAGEDSLLGSPMVVEGLPIAVCGNSRPEWAGGADMVQGGAQ